MRSFIATLTCVVASSHLIAAQSAADFSRLPIKVGDRIYVTEAATGVEISGPLKTLTSGELALDGYTFTPGSTLKIERPGDPLWDGALIGWGVGALIGATVGAESCLHRSHWHCVAEGGFSYALFGLVIDFAHKGRRTIYKGSPAERGKAVHLVPAIAPDRKTIALAVGF
jgi:hypothetical protein